MVKDYMAQIARNGEPIRHCFACNAPLWPMSPLTWTAHEFKCGKTSPDLIPAKWRDEHQQVLAWERRSAAAKRGAATRKARRVPKGWTSVDTSHD